MMTRNNASGSPFDSLRRFLRDRFDLGEDSALQDEVVDNICRGVDFRGTNLWVLIFATFVASLGLNVNSTAVIIGAMLISPLMGPIMGMGLSVGINDFDLLKRSVRNFGFMVLVSILTSTLYFVVSPLSGAQSELLARTVPTTYDVLIAFFGGLAGIVAQSRRDRTSTVIPGVAIATALMPPLCTAGYGLSQAKLIVRQNGEDDHVDLVSLQSGYRELIAEKNRRIGELERKLSAYATDTLPSADIAREMRAMVPSLREVSLSKTIRYGSSADTLVLCVVRTDGRLPAAERAKIETWLRARTRTDSLKLYIE